MSKLINVIVLCILKLIYYSLNSVWDDEDILSSVVSTTHKSGASMKSVGASYYSYLTGVEKQLREERETRVRLEEEIRQMRKKQDELSEQVARSVKNQ